MTCEELTFTHTIEGRNHMQSGGSVPNNVVANIVDVHRLIRMYNTSVNTVYSFLFPNRHLKIV